MTKPKRARQKANRAAKLAQVKPCGVCGSVRHRAPALACKRWRAEVRGYSLNSAATIRDSIAKAKAKARRTA